VVGVRFGVIRLVLRLDLRLDLCLDLRLDLRLVVSAQVAPSTQMRKESTVVPHVQYFPIAPT
jgi:hypothetical protein